MADTLYDVKDGIAIITLNRPEKLNSVTMAQLEELAQKANEFEQDDAVRAIIITGTGKGFSTGADLGGAGGRRGFQSGAELRHYHCRQKRTFHPDLCPPRIDPGSRRHVFSAPPGRPGQSQGTDVHRRPDQR